jgi:predicted acylesterase/phospholipase RssA
MKDGTQIKLRHTLQIRPRTAAVQEAYELILSGNALSPGDALALTKRLKAERQFGYARRILALARLKGERSAAQGVLLGQQHALCTYKDPDLPAEQKLVRALKILEEVDNPDSGTAEQETLGIAGAIWKRRWEVDAQREHLERSLAYYTAGYERGIAADFGYTAINAAFVLDLIAAGDSKVAAISRSTAEAAAARREKARDIRRQVVAALTALRAEPEGKKRSRQWWFMATLTEAHFGLGDYCAALNALRHALRIPSVDEWEIESTARQLAGLARLQAAGTPVSQLAYSAPWRVVARLVGNSGARIPAAFAGKVGLALSGGGFRASLFHIGVLARLAELDVLRHVEVLSCVSGGSIIGAHYYLKVKALLESKADRNVTRDDYVAIVQQLERDFLVGVQRNIRMRVLAEFTTNVRMFGLRSFTRTQRAGELYEEEIFSRMKGDGSRPDTLPDLRMTNLLIRPLGERNDFRPVAHNWVRSAKVPILVLNATSLNSGHNWQFTATWMGEPPGEIDADVDGNDRLRRLYYDNQAPEPYKTKTPVRLGHAVAASAAVPGLFDPLELPDLYERRDHEGKRIGPITVRLVDGGVHDNQGTASLAEQQCTIQLVSDASGQMSTVDEPSASALGVLLRSTSIQGARIRVAQYDALSARRRAHVLRGLMFVHLKRDLGMRNLDWRGCDEPYAQFGDVSLPLPDTAKPRDNSITCYGIPKHIQALLAEIRTDLDSFSDAEAYALMLSGYRMTTHDYADCGIDFGVGEVKEEKWAFRAIEGVMTGAGKADDEVKRRASLVKALKVARGRAFKVWKLDPVLKVLGPALILGLIAWLVWAVVRARHAPVPLPSPTIGELGLSVGLIILAFVVGGIINRILAVLQYGKTLRRFLVSLALAGGGFLVARIHLWIFDRRFIKWGGIRRFRPASAASRQGVGQ